MAICLEHCTFLGGSGYPFAAAQEMDVWFGADAIHLQLADGNRSTEIFYAEVVDLVITGPGSVTTGGGFIGGGFGIEGALEGIAIATVLNWLTTRTKVYTFVQIVAHQGELFFHYAGLEPGALRIALSPVFNHLRHLASRWFEARLQHLDTLRIRGNLSEEQFTSFKARLLSTLESTGLDDVKPPSSFETTKCNSCGAIVFSFLTTCDVCGKPLSE